MLSIDKITTLQRRSNIFMQRSVIKFVASIDIAAEGFESANAIDRGWLVSASMGKSPSQDRCVAD